MSAVIFLAAAPFAKQPLAPVGAFIPIYESALTINDLITAVLLFGQFGILRARGLLILASGYMFTAFMTVSHALSFPGLFSATGLFGAGPQSTAWLYMFWHGGFPLLVITYALISDSPSGERRPESARLAILGSIVAVLVAVGGLTLLATAGQDLLPSVMVGAHHTGTQRIAIASIWLLSLLALVVLWHRRPHSVLDVWLLVVTCAWLFDIALAGGLNGGRFDLGFYAGRIYGLLAASSVLLVLLLENGRLYARLVDVHERLVEVYERERGERQRMQQAEEAAATANRAKSEFLSRMSHELRTPLNGILGFAQLLELEAQSPDQRESVGHILKGGRHLLALINEVLDIARIEAGKLSISLEPVAASEVVCAALELVRPQAAARSTNLPETVEWGRYVKADRQRLQQVLLNLLSNAIKYNRAGGEVAVVCDETAAGTVRIAVSDTGLGIAPELLDRLFIPFDRLGAEQSSIEGTGLGLALSKRLVEAMGGTLEVASIPSKGSTFTVELPIAADPTAALMHADEPVVNGGPLPAHGTVLYIEDNLSNLRLLERVVSRRPGVTLISAMQGTQGLELARHHRPQVILLDLHLPDLPGVEVLKRLRDDPRTRSTPVVVLSADATPGQVTRLLAEGARAYLTKPLDVKALLRSLDEMLDGGGR